MNGYLLSLSVCHAAFRGFAAEPLPVVLQRDIEADGRPVETLLSSDGRFLMEVMAFSNSGGSQPADVSPDAKYFAIAADTVYLVQAASGKTAHKLTPHTKDGVPKPIANPPTARTASPASVLGLAFSRDGKHLAALEKDGTITVWETASGKVKAVLAGQPISSRPPVELTWFDDDTLLTPNSITDGKLSRWDITTGRAASVSWSSPDVPGFVVKCTSVSKLRTDLKLEIVLKQVVNSAASR